MARFLAKIEPTPTGCWAWTGTILAGGYGQFWFEGKMRLAHRWSYSELRGPIPPGFNIDHLCRNRRCVNPAHLEPVTQKENVARGFNFQSRKTHCPHGHEYNEKNTYWRKRGGRDCRACALAYYYARKREAGRV